MEVKSLKMKESREIGEDKESKSEPGELKLWSTKVPIGVLKDKNGELICEVKEYGQ